MKSEQPAFVPDGRVGWRHEIIPPEHAEDCPYMERWVVGIGPGKFWKRAKEDGPNAWFAIRLHHFFRSDEDHLHDHPWWFLTLVLRGSYEDWTECPACHGSQIVIDPALEADPEVPKGQDWMPCLICEDPTVGPTGQVLGDRMTPGTIRFRPALHRHRVVTDGVWTLCVSGPKFRDWGFHTPEGWLRQRAYFRKYGGSAACE